jgi:hypothetical protein
MGEPEEPDRRLLSSIEDENKYSGVWENNRGDDEQCQEHRSNRSTYIYKK